MPFILLWSRDGKVIPMDVEVAKVSAILKEMMETITIDEEDDTPIPLGRIDADILNKIVLWAERHYKDSRSPTPSPCAKKVVKRRIGWTISASGMNNSWQGISNAESVFFRKNFLEDFP